MFESVGAAAASAGCAISSIIKESHHFLIVHTHILRGLLLFHHAAGHTGAISNAAVAVQSPAMLFLPMPISLCVSNVWFWVT
jgi:hypothetical protein